MNLLLSAERLATNACADLLASIGYRATPRPRADIARILERPQDYAAGIVDFAGEAMRGRVVLLSAFDFFAASRKAGAISPQSAADQIRVRDWTMELTNQLVGRIKNQLCAIGTIVEAGLPKAVSDHALRVTVKERKGPHRAFVGEHVVVLWFEAVILASPTERPRVAPASEGDIITF
jgi:Chemotaxis phosphatase CheX